MSKKLRRKPLYIAPEIIGWLDENGEPVILDERTGQKLNPSSPNDKIIIYERQVKGWFLEPAHNLIVNESENNGFVILMLCISYLEGVEQYKQGERSYNKSKRFFISSMKNLYPNKFNEDQLDTFYSQARCGLFHNGMVEGKIIINNDFLQSINFSGKDIKISPSKLLKDIMKDFDDYLKLLRSDEKARNLFANLYSNI